MAGINSMWFMLIGYLLSMSMNDSSISVLDPG